jgi:putative Holliday junction resolvase
VTSTAAPLPRYGRLLAIDWGERRIGLAICDPDQRVAHPLATLTRRQGRRFPLKQLRPHLDEHAPVGIVFSLPLDPSGHEGPAARRAREEGGVVGDKSGLPLVFLDERMTTARALGAVRDLGGSTKGREGEVDQLAATVLLQSYLDGLAR